MACCLPDAPGYCPGPDRCPLNQTDAPEPHNPSASDIMAVTYVEFEGSRLGYAEWTEKDGTTHFGSYDEDSIPYGVREFLAKKITGA